MRARFEPDRVTVGRTDRQQRLGLKQERRKIRQSMRKENNLNRSPRVGEFVPAVAAQSAIAIYRLASKSTG
jgi:hypothetical protein